MIHRFILLSLLNCASNIVTSLLLYFEWIFFLNFFRRNVFLREKKNTRWNYVSVNISNFNVLFSRIKYGSNKIHVSRNNLFWVEYFSGKLLSVRNISWYILCIPPLIANLQRYECRIRKLSSVTSRNAFFRRQTRGKIRYVPAVHDRVGPSVFKTSEMIFGQFPGDFACCTKINLNYFHNQTFVFHIHF